MCVAVPLLVREVMGNRAVLSCSGVVLEADVSLVDEVQPGDFLLVHAGFAIAKVDAAEAAGILECHRLQLECGARS